MQNSTIKKIVLAIAVGMLTTACSTPLTAQDITDDLITYTTEKRQYVLETQPSQKLLPWQNNGNQGRMMVTRTTQRPDGTYCRMLWEETFVGKKKLTLHNQWCRDKNGKWRLQISVSVKS